MFQTACNYIRSKQAKYYTSCIKINFQHISTGASVLFNHTKRFKHVKPEHRPGLERRVKLINENRCNSKHAFDTGHERDGSMEPDLENVGEMFNIQKCKIQLQNEYQKLKIVRQKYFKTSTQPNFLTWAEKEQIRYLHDNDPDEWSTDKLAQSFPASETIIKKVIKSQWNVEDSRKILNHDKAVNMNWKALLSGKLEVEPNLKIHLYKFSKRKQATFAHTFMEQTRSSTPPNNSKILGEFSNIIESYSNSPKGNLLSNKAGFHETRKISIPVPKSVIPPVPIHTKTEDSDTYVLDNLKQNNETQVTLDKYREQNQLEDLSASGMKSSNKTVIGFNDYKKDIPVVTENIKVNKLLKPVRPTTKAVDNLSNYQENVKIPKDKWKQGGTFKIGECYYDDDGEFLYRVPGMK